jgi:hypothetical protein
METKYLGRSFVALLTLCQVAACVRSSADYQWMAPGTARVWRPSFVVLFGSDSMAPAKAPRSCKRLAGIEFVRSGDKVYHFDTLRREAQNIGGNGATEIKLVTRRGREFHYKAVIVHCPESLFAT